MWKQHVWKSLLATAGLAACALMLWQSSAWQAQQDVPVVADVLGEADEVEAAYDLIVVGGEAEGVVAAVAGAQSGLKTLLIEKRDGLGGVLTFGMLNYLDTATYRGQPLNTGLFTAWHKEVGGEVVFDPEQAKQVFRKMVAREPNVELRLRTEVVAPLFDKDNPKQLAGVKARRADGTVIKLRAKRVIDATEDADVAAMAGAPYFVGQEDIGINAQMSVTLMIHLKDVDWQGVKKACAQQLYGGCMIADRFAWGFLDLKSAYQPKEPGTRLRGLNIARNQDGTLMINALQVLGVDGLDPVAKQQAYAKGKRETEHVLAFFRAKLPGFERAKIASWPQELYIRETRHVLAEYQLSIADVWENKDQWDRIGYGGYPVDLQANEVVRDDVILADPERYAIPYRSLVPLRVENLLVVGRAAGFSSLAAGSARTVPTGMTQGEAAGVAAALSLQHQVSFRELAHNKQRIAELQAVLQRRGALPHVEPLDYPYKGAWYYPAVRDLLTHGLIAGHYRNEIDPDGVITEAEFVELLRRVGHIAVQEREADVTAQLQKLAAQPKPLTRDRMGAMIQPLLHPTPSPNGGTWKAAATALHPAFAERFPDNRAVLKQEAYWAAAQLLKKAR